MMKKISQRDFLRVIVVGALFACPLWGMDTQEVEEQVSENRTPDVVFVTTPQDVVDEMLELAKVKKDDLLYDLGCGDGRIVVTAAKRFGCRAVGYDIDHQRVKESLENVEKNNVGHLVKIEHKDIFTLDLSKADVITLYLLPELNVKLIPQLEKLKPGSRIVSHDFRMRGVITDKVVALTSNEDSYEHRIYLWTSPLKKGEEDYLFESADLNASWIDDGYYLPAGLPYVDVFDNTLVPSNTDVPEPPDYNETADMEASEELSLNKQVTNLIEEAIAEKDKVLERIDASIEKGTEAYEALEQILTSGDYGDEKRDDIIRARAGVYVAIELEKYFKKVQGKAINELEYSLSVLKAELYEGSG